MKMQEFSSRKDISPQRRALYYTGMVLMGIGVIAFLSVFVRGALGISNMNMFDRGPGFMVWGIAGFILILIGSILRGIGARGLAGSGVVLDPQKAREDLSPYTGAIGGMAKDVVESFREAGGQAEKEPQIMVRCTSCKALNPENAKYCSQCGQSL